MFESVSRLDHRFESYTGRRRKLRVGLHEQRDRLTERGFSVIEFCFKEAKDNDKEKVAGPNKLSLVEMTRLADNH